jgi:hypothetical protein
VSDLAPIVVGGALTLIGGAGTEWLRDRRATSRGAKDREEVRQERRDDLERQTLIELQDALQGYVRGVAKAVHFDEMNQRQQGRQFLLPDGLSDEIHAAQMMTAKLTSRVADEEIRDWIGDVIEQGIAATMPNPDHSRGHFEAMGGVATLAQAKIGARIRDL